MVSCKLVLRLPALKLVYIYNKAIYIIILHKTIFMRYATMNLNESVFPLFKKTDVNNCYLPPKSVRQLKSF